ncbi:hypothetical protein JXA32_08165 [Candidatus Sumerlaeota bacterium]|nr:hypothetical protein [Candidatus Sumerlaeota bacterium]
MGMVFCSFVSRVVVGEFPDFGLAFKAVAFSTVIISIFEVFGAIALLVVIPEIVENPRYFLILEFFVGVFVKTVIYSGMLKDEAGESFGLIRGFLVGLYEFVFTMAFRVFYLLFIASEGSF